MRCLVCGKLRVSFLLALESGGIALQTLHEWVAHHPRLFVLTGAGVSTGSGIPGYRDLDGQWQRKPPVTHQEFTGSEAVRKRYWARSAIGFPVMAHAQPNAAHRALAQLESTRHIAHLVTQNVDGLHQLAGSQRVTELHGSIRQIVCLACGARTPRAGLQVRLLEANPQLAAQVAVVAPDGDADLEGVFEEVTVPACTACGGMLKPDVVFFGAGVPRARLEVALEALAQADAMLVAGSSLMVYSGYRFCLRAKELGKPIAAINLGRTRADDLFALKVEEGCAPALQRLVETPGVAVGVAT